MVFGRDKEVKSSVRLGNQKEMNGVCNNPSMNTKTQTSSSALCLSAISLQMRSSLFLILNNADILSVTGYLKTY